MSFLFVLKIYDAIYPSLGFSSGPDPQVWRAKLSLRALNVVYNKVSKITLN